MPPHRMPERRSRPHSAGPPSTSQLTRPMPDRALTAVRAQRAAADAAASLGGFAKWDSLASRDRPAGWPSTRRDQVYSDLGLYESSLREGAEWVSEAAERGHSVLNEAPHSRVPAGLGKPSERAPSHVLVARALGPVAGRAIVTERRMFIAQIDAAEQRCQQLEDELRAEREKLPAARAREQAALDRERMLRDERDHGNVGAEVARLEAARLRPAVEEERIRAERAEAQCQQLHRDASGEAAALRDLLEATQADWRCADTEARAAERALAVAQVELRTAGERISQLEERSHQEADRAAAKLAECEERCRELHAELGAARSETASVKSKLAGVQQMYEDAQEPIRQERTTLRQAVEMAESRCQLALKQVAAVEHDRNIARRELAALKIEKQLTAEKAAKREEALGRETATAVATAQALARQNAERCKTAEQQAAMTSMLLDEALVSAQGERSAAERTGHLLQAKHQRLQAAEVGLAEMAHRRYQDAVTVAASRVLQPRAAMQPQSGHCSTGGDGRAQAACAAGPCSDPPPSAPASATPASRSTISTVIGSEPSSAQPPPAPGAPPAPLPMPDLESQLPGGATPWWWGADSL